MAYIVTAEGDSVVYLGVKVYIEDHGDNKKEVHLTVHGREEEYPYHIVRYPEFGTVAPQQLRGGGALLWAAWCIARKHAAT